jgi:hypothetical protein
MHYHLQMGPNIFCLKKTNAAGTLEVHVLNALPDAGTNFLSFVDGGHLTTALGEADAANFDFAIANYGRGDYFDIYCLKKTNTGSTTFEVHVLSGVPDAGTNHLSFAAQCTTALGEADSANFVFSTGGFFKLAPPPPPAPPAPGPPPVNAIDNISVWLSFTPCYGSPNTDDFGTQWLIQNNHPTKEIQAVVKIVTVGASIQPGGSMSENRAFDLPPNNPPQLIECSQHPNAQTSVNSVTKVSAAYLGSGFQS